eukprot:Hpha_TRINITY_DN26373_c0_g1::TRINITY_DN26373_c0_g1_i1::g.9409::m.9409
MWVTRRDAARRVLYLRYPLVTRCGSRWCTSPPPDRAVPRQAAPPVRVDLTAVFAALRLTSTNDKDVSRAYQRLRGSDGELSTDRLTCQLLAHAHPIHSLSPKHVHSLAPKQTCPEVAEAQSEAFLRMLGGTRLSEQEFTSAVQKVAAKLDSRAYALATAIGVAFCGFGVTMPMGPELIRTFSLTGVQVGALMGCFAVSKLLGNIPSSVLANAYGRTTVVSGGLVCISVGLIGTGCAENFTHLLLARSLVGFGVSGTFTAAAMYIADISHPLNSARSRMPMMMGMQVGMMLGPGAGGYMLDWLGLQGACVCVGTGTTLVALCVGTLLPDSGSRRLRGTFREQFRHTVSGWRPLLRIKGLRHALLWGGCWHATLFGFTTLLPLWYVQLDISTSTVGALFAMNAFVAFISQPVFASLADRFGKLFVIIPGAVCYSTNLVVAVPMVESLTQLIPILIVGQMSAAMCGQGMAYATDKVSTTQRGQVPGLWNTVGDLGMLSASVISSSLADAYSTEFAMRCSGILLFIATLFFALMVK